MAILVDRNFVARNFREKKGLTVWLFLVKKTRSRLLGLRAF